jgi:hypothetical protein
MDRPLGAFPSEYQYKTKKQKQHAYGPKHRQASGIIAAALTKPRKALRNLMIKVDHIYRKCTDSQAKHSANWL